MPTIRLFDAVNPYQGSGSITVQNNGPAVVRYGVTDYTSTLAVGARATISANTWFVPAPGGSAHIAVTP